MIDYNLIEEYKYFCNDTKFLTKNTDVRQININENIYVSPDYNLKHIWKD